MRLLKRLLSARGFMVAIAIASSLSCASAFAKAEHLRVDIAGGKAPETIRQFVEQTRFQVLFEFEAVRDSTTQAVRGDLKPEDALRHMLESSGLVYELINERTALIAPKSHLLQRQGSTEVSRPRNDSGPNATGDTGDSAVSDLPPRRAGSGSTSSESAQRTPSLAYKRVRDQQLVVDEVVITGTHIRGIAPESSPVKIYDRTDIERTGVSTVEQFVRTMPQNFSSVDSSSINSNTTGGFNQLGGNSFGGAGVNLHGLGPGGTLTLVNGHRLAGAGTSGEFVDVSLIPLSAVERIEVLSDGASALYGAEAVAGVVNFVLRKDFDGIETSLRDGGATRGGGGELTGSQLFGKSWRSGNAMLVYEHSQQDGLVTTARDFVPDQSASSVLIPAQKRHSAFLSGRQETWLQTQTTIDASYSNRDFQQDLSGGGITQHVEGGSEQVSASLAVTRKLFSRWNGEFAATYSKTEQAFTNVFLTSATHSEADTQLIGADLRADGPLFDAPGGAAKLAFGASFRNEQLRNVAVGGGAQLARDVGSGYVEMFVPVVGSANQRTGLRRLSVSLAGRYDHYDDAGSSTNPKFGIAWSPVSGFSFRGTYATSFRAPALTRLITSPSFFTFRISDPTASDGFTNTLLNQSGGNPNLGPEKAESFTIGFDLQPERSPALSIGATYFDTKFRGRISSPPILGGNFQLIYSQPTSLAPFIDRSPDLTEVQQIFASPGFRGDFARGGPAGVEAIFDNRLLNIAATQESGIELYLTYDLQTQRRGLFAFSVFGNYLLNIDYQTLSGTPEIELVDTLAQPTDLKAHGSISWSLGSFTSSMNINYADEYKNVAFNPAQEIRSWTTIDLNLGYAFGSQGEHPIVRDLKLSVSARNLLDEDPPLVVIPSNLGFFNVGFDPVNASPMGRVVTLAVSKRW